MSVIDGPDGMFSPDRPPSRGMYRSIAIASLELLGIEPPQTQLDATEALVRLRLALRDGTEDVPEVPPL
jgi:hypothetical protein